MKNNINLCELLLTVVKIETDNDNPPGTRRCCDVESTSMTLIIRRNNVVCLVEGHGNTNFL